MKISVFWFHLGSNSVIAKFFYFQLEFCLFYPFYAIDTVQLTYLPKKV